MTILYFLLITRWLLSFSVSSIFIVHTGKLIRLIMHDFDIGGCQSYHKFEIYLGQMYPAELEIKDTTESNTSASYLDLLLSIESDGQLRTSLYDKRDDFNFHITNFPFLSSNIPSSPAYGVFISQLIRYARACSSYECFILRAARLSSKLLRQGYVMECL